MDSSKTSILILTCMLALAGAGNGISKLTRKELGGGAFILVLSFGILISGLFYCGVI